LRDPEAGGEEEADCLRARVAAVSRALVLAVLWSLAGFALLVSGAAAAEVPEVARLIDGLQGVDEPDLGYSSFEGGGSAFFPTSENGPHSATMTAIVRLGARAVPDLIRHISDGRPTGVEGGAVTGFGGFFLLDEYDWSPASGVTLPADVNVRGLSRTFAAKEGWTVRVGDLCFVALGQIVNRRFQTLRYQPSGLVVASSPVAVTPLAAAVVREWGDLTPEEHRRRLLADLADPDMNERAEEALERLGFYYGPALVEPYAVSACARPVYSHAIVRAFVDQVEAADSPLRGEAARKRLAEILVRHGEHYRDGILHYLVNERERYVRVPRGALFAAVVTEVATPEQAEKALRAVIWNHWANADTIRALRRTKSSQVDDVVELVLVELTQGTEAEQNEHDVLALACMEHLFGKGRDERLRAYLKKRLATADRYREQLEELAGRLGK